MNSGCYGEDISKILISIDVVDLKVVRKKHLRMVILNFITEVQIYQTIFHYINITEGNVNQKT